MIKVTNSNVETLSKEIMTNAKKVSMTYLENGKFKGACEYGFTKTSTPESRACAVQKLYHAIEVLPEKCGELFATIV